MPPLLEIGLTNAVLATVLALGVLVVGLFIRRRPALLYALWLVVLIKLITPPLWSVPVLTRPALPALAALGPESVEALADPSVLASAADATELLPIPPAALDDLGGDSFVLSEEAAEPNATAGAETPGTTGSAVAAIAPEAVASAEPSWLEWLAYWPEAVMAVWLTGVLGWFMLGIARVVRFRRLLRHASPAPQDLQERADYLAKRLGLQRSPRVWLAPGAVSPMLWAIGCRPRLILPAQLVGRLRWSRLDTLLLHELAHVRRRDHWVRWLELIVTGLYWWHPIVWWARRELRDAEEQCCDAWVVWALPQATRSYALALVETVDFLAEARPVLPLAASGFGHVNDLKRRLTMIMRGRTPRTLTWAGCLTVVGLGAALLAVQPTWADDDEKPRARGGDERRDPEKRPPPRAEEQGRGRGEGERGRDDLERARNEVREMAEQVRRMQRQLQEAEERLRDASQRLERMAGGGRDAPRGGEGRGGGPATGAPGGRGGPGIGAPGTGGPPGAGPGFPGGPGAGAGAPPGVLPGSGGGFPGGGGGFAGGRGGGGFGGGMAGFGGFAGGRGGEDVNRRLEELERKIDTLIREFERMRGDRREGPRDSPPPVRRDERGRSGDTAPPMIRRGEGEGGRGYPRPPEVPAPPARPTPPRRDGDAPLTPVSPKPPARDEGAATR